MTAVCKTGDSQDPGSEKETLWVGEGAVSASRVGAGIKLPYCAQLEPHLSTTSHRMDCKHLLWVTRAQTLASGETEARIGQCSEHRPGKP